MPSVLNDFLLDYKKAHPDVDVADPGTDRVWNWRKGNIYRRTVTVDNTGITARTNYIQRIIWDTRAIHGANKISPTLNDLRVYDSDGVTRLEHYVFAPNTPYTVIVVKMSHTTNQVKSIFFEYGNPALQDLGSITAVAGSVMGKATKILECFSVEPYRMGRMHLLNSDKVHWWNNRARPFSSPLNRRAFIANMPQFQTGIVSGLPVIWFNGSQTLFTWDQHNLRTTSTDGVTMFTLCYADTSIQRYQRQLSFQDASGGFMISHWWTGSQAHFILSNDGGTAGGLNTGVVNGQWNLSTCRWGRNETNGMYTRRNGALVAQRNSLNTALVQPTEWNQFSMGTFNITSEYFNGYLAAALIFDEALNATEVGQVEALINGIYQTYGSHATVTIGSESTISGGDHSFTSYSPFSSFDIVEDSETVGTFASVEGKATIQRMLEKTLAVGSDRDGAWQISSEDTTSGALSAHVCRSRTATTSAGIDYVNIERTISAVNVNDLSIFYQTNLVDASNYASTNNDYIEFDFWCQDHTKIDTTSSYISFTDTAETKSYFALLSANVNVLASNKLCKVRIKKSSFTPVSSPTWSFVSQRLKINVQTTTGTQTVKYGVFKLVKNYEDDTMFHTNKRCAPQLSRSTD